MVINNYLSNSKSVSSTTVIKCCQPRWLTAVDPDFWMELNFTSYVEDLELCLQLFPGPNSSYPGIFFIFFIFFLQLHFDMLALFQPC